MILIPYFKKEIIIEEKLDQYGYVGVEANTVLRGDGE